MWKLLGLKTNLLQPAVAAKPNIFVLEMFMISAYYVEAVVCMNGDFDLKSTNSHLRESILHE